MATIEVIEGQHASAAVRALSPGAPCFIVVDPSEGSLTGREEAMQMIRRNYMEIAKINFTQCATRVNGKIIHVGEKVDPLIVALNTPVPPRKHDRASSVHWYR